MLETNEESKGVDDDTINIVRYPNRRFYDRSRAGYVTLQEIAAMVREGKTVNVRDSKSNEDLTTAILMQIVLEHYPERMNLLPAPVLHHLIRANDVVLGLLRDYFRQSSLYLDLWQQASRLNPMTTSMEWLKSIVPSTQRAPNSTEPGNADLLIQRLADMERRIGALEPPPDTRASAPERPAKSAKPARPRSNNEKE